MRRIGVEKNQKNEIFAFQTGGNESYISGGGGGDDGFFEIVMKSHTSNPTRMTSRSL
jgi:hypothetical protein